jgi:hypothetical protein
MVNFRFHVVSIIAIFLAIAIGTVMGATFVGRGVVDRLQNRIDDVERTSNDVKAKNEELESAAGQNAKYVDQTAGYAVGRSLDGVRIDVVAERGIDGATVDRQVALLRQAGATVPGVIWLEDAWQLDQPEELEALREATGLTNRAPGILRVGAAAQLGRRLATSAPLPTDDVLARLAAAEFVTLTGADGSPTPTAPEFDGSLARSLVIGGPGSSVPLDTTPAMAEGLVDGADEVAIGEVFVADGDTVERNTWIDAITSDDALRNNVSTIDDVERSEGQVAATLALAQLGTGTVGDYGLGRDRAVPENVVTTPLAR